MFQKRAINFIKLLGEEEEDAPRAVSPKLTKPNKRNAPKIKNADQRTRQDK